MGPLPELLCHEECPLVRCEAMWDCMCVDQVIFKPPENVAGECLQPGKATTYLERVSISVSAGPTRRKGAPCSQPVTKHPLGFLKEYSFALVFTAGRLDIQW